jgi:hypothetical protein
MQFSTLYTFAAAALAMVDAIAVPVCCLPSRLILGLSIGFRTPSFLAT